MPKVTDPALLLQLEGTDGKVTDPALLAQLNGTPSPRGYPHDADMPTTLDILRRGAEWLASKQDEAEARVRAKDPGTADALHLFTGLLGMGATRLSPTMAPVSVRQRAVAESAPQPAPAIDPVAEQIARANRTTPEAVDRLPDLPKALRWLLPHKATMAYDLGRKLAGKTTPAIAENPYPAGAFEVTPRPEPMPPPAAAPKALDPLLQKAAEESRARVLARMTQEMTAPAEAATPGATLLNATRAARAPRARPQPPPEASAPQTITASDLSPATAERMQTLQGLQAPAPAAPQTVVAPRVNPYEMAARGQKVSELIKAIDANAGVHLGVDMRDPRAAEALASLPPAWWEGMAQVSKVNKPSPETIAQALQFFRERASRGGVR